MNRILPNSGILYSFCVDFKGTHQKNALAKGLMHKMKYKDEVIEN